MTWWSNRVTVPVLVKRIIDGYRRSRADWSWARFLGDTTPGLGDLQSVFLTLRNGQLTTMEQRLLDSIGRRRAELAASHDVITYRDFGAGTPDHPRSEQQLLVGVPSERAVADLVKASIPQSWGLLLLKLIRQFRPTCLVELGSALGISGSFQTAALRLNDEGHLFTLEGCPGMAERARETLSRIDDQRATVVSGRFQDTLPGVLDRMGQVDFAFIDGHHDEQATIDYWSRIRDRMTGRSIAVFDDCNWSAGMQRAWQQVIRDPSVACSIDLGKFGLCLCHDERFDRAMQFRLPYPTG